MEDIKRAEATAKMVRIAPQARLVIDLVRGKDLNLYAILSLTDKKLRN